MDKTKAALLAIVIIASVTFLILFVILKRSDPEPEKEDGENPLKLNITGDVIDLTTENFTEVLRGNEYVLVDFYSQRCGHCIRFAPEYEKAAKILASEGSQVLFTRVDVESETKLQGELNGQAFPVIKLYRNSSGLVTFDDASNARNLIRWLYNKIGSPTRIISNIDQALTTLEENNIVVFGFFKQFGTVSVDTFKEAAALTEEYHFAITNSSEVMDRLNVKEDSVYLFKRDDQEKLLLEDPISVFNIQRFIKNHAHPLISDYNSETKGIIFGGDFNVQIWFALSSTRGDYANFLPTIRKVAEELRYQLFFVTIDITKIANRRLLADFGVELNESSQPRVFILKTNEDLKTFKADEGMELTEANIKQFIEEFSANRLIPEINH